MFSVYIGVLAAGAVEAISGKFFLLPVQIAVSSAVHGRMGSYMCYRVSWAERCEALPVPLFGFGKINNWVSSIFNIKNANLYLRI